jgi:hypothetical protein
MYNVFSNNEKKILDLVCSHNVVTSKQLSEFMNVSVKYVNKLLKGFIEGGYIYRKDVTRRLVVYGCFQKGMNTLHLPYKANTKVNLVTLNHNLTLVDLELHLMGLMEEVKDDVKWYTERDIYYSDILGTKFERLSEVPDGVLVNDSGKFAIELELSKKERSKWKKKIYNYNENITKGLLDGVIYYTSDKYIMNNLSVLKKSYINDSKIEINYLPDSDRFNGSYTKA